MRNVTFSHVVVWRPDRGPDRGGGARSKGTINWLICAHSAIDARARLHILGGLSPRAPFPAPEVGFRGGSIQLKGHCFFIHSANVKVTFE